MQYTEQVIELFSDPKHFFIPGTEFEIVGNAGDFNVGEQVYIYLNVERNGLNKFSTIIKQAAFSAMGSVMLIATAEKLCSSLQGKSIGEALSFIFSNTTDGSFEQSFPIPENRLHSVGFVTQAFHDAISRL